MVDVLECLTPQNVVLRSSASASFRSLMETQNPIYRISPILRQEMAGFVAQVQVIGSRLSRTGVALREDKKLPRPGYICPDRTCL